MQFKLFRMTFSLPLDGIFAYRFLILFFLFFIVRFPCQSSPKPESFFIAISCMLPFHSSLPSQSSVSQCSFHSFHLENKPTNPRSVTHTPSPIISFCVRFLPSFHMRLLICPLSFLISSLYHVSKSLANPHHLPNNTQISAICSLSLAHTHTHTLSCVSRFSLRRRQTSKILNPKVRFVSFLVLRWKAR